MASREVTLVCVGHAEMMSAGRHVKEEQCNRQWLSLAAVRSEMKRSRTCEC